MTQTVFPNTLRRDMLAMTPCVLLAAASVAIGAKGPHSRDAELIEVCQKFAEADFDDWYAYVTATDHEVTAGHEDSKPDWATLHWIEATPATTLEGLRAKALAFVAWHKDAFDNSPDDRDPSSPLLASLMRDLAAPARAAIIARLFEKYGPLPKGYTRDGVWLGAEAAYGPDSVRTGAGAVQ